MSVRLESALEYAQMLGFAVFPVAADCRVPMVEHGVHEASSDPAVIRGWWRQHPSANIAVAAGVPSGVLIVDIDAKDGKDGFASLQRMVEKYGPLPVTPRSSTPSGGAHLYFRYPAGRELRNRVNLSVWRDDGSRERYEGVDIRSNGGSAALPPSCKPSGVYAWEIDPTDQEFAEPPSWLVELIDPPEPPRPAAAPVRLDRADRMARYVERAVNGECEELAGMKPGSGRNLKLFQAAANLGELVAANLLPQSMAEAALERAASDCGLTREDGLHAVRASIRSGFQRGFQRPREVRA